MKQVLKNKLVIALIAFTLLGVFAYKKIISGQSSASTDYQTSSVEKGTLVVSLSAAGQVAATNSRTVTTTASGVVKKVYVKEGQKVSLGTPIMSIDLDLEGQQKYQSAYASYIGAQNALASAKTKLLDLESAFVGAKNVFDNQWANQSPDDPTYKQKHNAYLSAQAAFEQQQKVITQAESSLASARVSYLLASPTVYAPIPGIVSAISLTPGMILNPTSTAANASNSENKIAIVKTGATPAITVSLTEIDVPKVKVGNQATITLDAFSGKTYTGKIIAIDTAGTVSSGVVSYPTTIQLDTEVEQMLSNMSAGVKIISKVKDNILLVENGAVSTVNGVSTVRVLKDGNPQSVTVEVGDSNDTHTEIISGLNPGDSVVINSLSSATGQSSNRQGQSTSVFGGMGGGANRIFISK